MTPIELAAAAREALEQPGPPGLILTLPKGGMPRGFPRGELRNEMMRGGKGERTYRFEPARVLAWLQRHGLVEAAVPVKQDADANAQVITEQPPRSAA